MKILKKITAAALCLFIGITAVSADMIPFDAMPAWSEEQIVINTDDEIILSSADVAGMTMAQLDIKAGSMLLMDADTGKVMYEQNAHEQRSPASITKIMTMLLVMEEIERGSISLQDKVTASPHACSMGGSQIWLGPNEVMTVDELLRAVAIGSANDASVALAEFISGSEEVFADRMNRRSAELGMTKTVFKNASGLDEDGHVSTAFDIAIMSRELLKHELASKYSAIWMDSLRGGKTALVNTNKVA